MFEFIVYSALTVSHDKNNPKMPSFFMKKQYLAIVMLFFILLLLFNNRPVSIQCQLSSDTPSVLPTIYAITPTHSRLTQKADLTRLSQTLMMVKDLHWIVIEDSDTKTNLVSQLLAESNLKYVHLHVKTHQKKGKNSARGVEQRNLALDWLRKHLRNSDDKRGVVFFMDDDNTYSLKVFDEMRKVKHVGIWPVGLVGGMRVEMPLVKDGKVTGFNAIWQPQRPFPIDMAGFAINATLFLEYPTAKFTRNVKPGYQASPVFGQGNSTVTCFKKVSPSAGCWAPWVEQRVGSAQSHKHTMSESEILRHVTKREDLEPLADHCTKVYVWHTRTEKPSITTPKKKNPSYDNIEV